MSNLVVRKVKLLVNSDDPDMISKLSSEDKATLDINMIEMKVLKLWKTFKNIWYLYSQIKNDNLNFQYP